MKRNNQNGGFIQIIILIIILLLVMRHYGITFSSVWLWLKELFYSVW